jgi:SOS-response transcriptional repressor LexA
MNIHHQKLRALAFIRNYMIEHEGEAPTVREIATALDHTSSSFGSRLVRALVAEGKIRHNPDKRRSIEIVAKATRTQPQSKLPSGTIAVELPPVIYAEISVIAEYARVPIAAVCLEAICHGLKSVRCVSHETSKTTSGAGNGRATHARDADR